MAGAKEVYCIPDHRLQDDSALLALPPQGPLTALTLFVCTYVAKLGNLHIGFVELTAIMCVNPHGPLVAINSNFGHACQPGNEHLLKTPKPPPERRAPMRGRARKGQGDTTCFNSAVEPILAIDHPGINDDKIYKVKCFPTTGETQVPGVICPDLSDGRAVLDSFVAYLNTLGVGDSGLEVTIVSQQPKMMNYKFRVLRSSPRILVNLHAFAMYMQILELTKATAETPLTEAQAARFAGWPVVVLPPYPVRETKPPTDDVKVSFRFRGADRAPRINVFQEGKINILGADSAESAQNIYEFFVRLFTENWTKLICLQPRRDLERRQAARAAAAPIAAPARPPPASLSDAEVDAVLAVLLGAENPEPSGAENPEPSGAENPAPSGTRAEQGCEHPSDDEVAELCDWWAQPGAVLQNLVLSETDCEDVEYDEEDPL
jgi:hypothetical protein